MPWAEEPVDSIRDDLELSFAEAPNVRNFDFRYAARSLERIKHGLGPQSIIGLF